MLGPGDQVDPRRWRQFNIVPAGRGDEFVELFNKFDYGDNNPFHRSRAQVKDSQLRRNE